MSYGVLLPSAELAPYDTPLCAGTFSVQPTVTVLPVVVVTGLLMTIAEFKEIVVDADLVLSCALVAVMIAEAPLLGAVNRPPEVMVPADVAQLTAEE